MPYKQQDKCFRIFKGNIYNNYSDLIMSEEENNKVIAEAKTRYKLSRLIKHKDGYYQLFVSKPHKYKAKFVDLGRGKVNKEVYFTTATQLHKEIQKHIVSKGWRLDETEEDVFIVASGYNIVGKVIISDSGLK